MRPQAKPVGGGVFSSTTTVIMFSLVSTHDSTGTRRLIGSNYFKLMIITLFLEESDSFLY